MTMRQLTIYHANLVTPYEILKDGYITICEDLIVDIGTGCAPKNGGRMINANGSYLSPGFIDIHTHGAGGHDFMDGTPEAFITAAQTHARFGTTALLPTTLAASFDEIQHTLAVFDKVCQISVQGARLLGIHLEGPYFSPAQKGAQDPLFIRNPDPEEYLNILSLSSHILRWSTAPELPGALEFGRELKRRGILASVAHSDADDTQVAEAFANGFTHVTHLYSSMSSVRRINGRRVAGVLEAAWLNDDMTVEIIADGVHLPASLLKLAYKIKGPDKIALVTDSMRAAGMPEGESILGSRANGQRVLVEGGAARLPDGSALAGSVATADRLVKNMVQLAGVPLEHAITMMTATPAKIIGAARRMGRLAIGMNADLVLFDLDINIQLTMVGGKIVHTAEPFGTIFSEQE